MLSDKIEKLPVKARSSITELFLNAALSYELGGDWKRCFRLARGRSLGSVKQFCTFWIAATDADMKKAIDVFIKEV